MATSDRKETLTADPGKPTVEMPADKAYFAHRTEVLYELQSELAMWAKRRFWVLGTIALGLGLLGAFGINSWIQEAKRALEADMRGVVEKELGRMKGEIDKEISRAQEQSFHAATAASKTEDAALKSTRAAEDATAQTGAAIVKARGVIAELQGSAQAVQDDLSSLNTKVQAESENLRAKLEKDAADITQRIASLEGLVRRLSAASEGSRLEIEAYQAELKQREENARLAAARFANNSRYSVTIYFIDSLEDVAEVLVKELAQAGFKASAASIRDLRMFETFPAKLPSGNTIVYTPETRAMVTTVRTVVRSAVEAVIGIPRTQISPPTRAGAREPITVYLQQRT